MAVQTPDDPNLDLKKKIREAFTVISLSLSLALPLSLPLPVYVPLFVPVSVSVFASVCLFVSFSDVFGMRSHVLADQGCKLGFEMKPSGGLYE